MKKVLAISILMVALALGTMATAPASETAWRFNIYADDGAGNAFTSAQFGVAVGSKDPLPSDVLPLTDSQDNPWVAAQALSWTVAGIFATDTAGLTKRAWNSDIKSNLKPWNSAYASQNSKKTWDLRVAGAGAATGSSMRLRFVTVAASLLPPSQLTYSTGPPIVYKPALYWLKMVNNRGKTGAPANGTIWVIPVPTSHSANSYFTLTLPALNISVEKSEAMLIAEGYEMQFYQTPEPSSLMALGAGLMALGGFATKRRKR